MGAEIVGYNQLSERAKIDLNKFLFDHGASINISDAELTTSGLILATRQDMSNYNETLEVPERRSFVGRCWELPLHRWLGYRKALSNRGGVPDRHVSKVFEQPELVNGFKQLFYDASHMNIISLKLCLDDGMTDRMDQMGPKMNDFLTGFADTTIKAAQGLLQN